MGGGDKILVGGTDPAGHHDIPILNQINNFVPGNFQTKNFRTKHKNLKLQKIEANYIQGDLRQINIFKWCKLINNLFGQIFFFRDRLKCVKNGSF